MREGWKLIWCKNEKNSKFRTISDGISTIYSSSALCTFWWVFPHSSTSYFLSTTSIWQLGSHVTLEIQMRQCLRAVNCDQSDGVMGTTHERMMYQNQSSTVLNELMFWRNPLVLHSVHKVQMLCYLPPLPKSNTRAPNKLHDMIMKYLIIEGAVHWEAFQSCMLRQSSSCYKLRLGEFLWLDPFCEKGM